MVRLHPHAMERLQERGANLEEVIETVQAGEQFPAKHGRTGFRHNFAYDDQWRGKYMVQNRWRRWLCERTTIGWLSP